MSEEERNKLRERDRENRARQRKAMSDEQREQMREKDRLSKAQKKSESKLEHYLEKWQIHVEHKHLVNWQSQFDKIQWSYWEKQPLLNTKDRSKSEPRKTPKWVLTEKEDQRKYRRDKRGKLSEAEKEYERIENLLIKRRSRSARTEAEVKSDNFKAMEGMQLERLIPFKGRRRYKCREEYLWWQYWKKGEEFKVILREKLPDFAERFTEWDSKKENPYAEVENVDGDVDIDDGKQRTEDQMKQIRKERLKRRRERIREQLNQPIVLEEFEKSEYELIRDRIIAERDKMMKEAEESGMFDPK